MVSYLRKLAGLLLGFATLWACLSVSGEIALMAHLLLAQTLLGSARSERNRQAGLDDRTAHCLWPIPDRQISIPLLLRGALSGCPIRTWLAASFAFR